jgi:hypothetical protein
MEGKAFFTGSDGFTTSELEVFEVTTKGDLN